MKGLLKPCFIAIVFFLPAGTWMTSFSQQPAYPEIFGNDWKKAEDFIVQNESWIKPVLRKYDIGFNEAMAIIFPELVRYSALRDRMEATLLKALYINLGKGYANFSIGHLQMKPSFAELLGKGASELSAHRYSSLVRDSLDFNDIRDYRSSIVKDLEDARSQINYLVVFYKICSKKFNLRKMDPEERIRFLATAYNYGFFRSEKEIVSMSGKKFFTASLFPREYYSYSDISVFWFRQNLGGK